MSNVTTDKMNKNIPSTNFNIAVRRSSGSFKKINNRINAITPIPYS